MGKACAVGVDFGGTRIKLGLVDASGNVLERGLRGTPREKGRDGILDELASGVRELGDIGRRRGLDVVGIGVGTPGPLDPTAEIVLLAPNIPSWENLPLKRLLEERVEQDVRLENDANAAALGEYWAGAGHGARTLVFLGLGTGVGGGIVLDGKLWRGAHGAGAELGHVTIDPDGEPCPCGNRGCLETLAATTAIVRGARRVLAEDSAPILARLLKQAGEGQSTEQRLTPALVAQAAAEGDAAAAAVFYEAGRWLGVAVAAFMNIFDPEMVIIGGGIAGAQDLILPAVREEARRRSFEVIHRNVAIVPAELGDDAGVVGAAAPFFLR